MGNLNGIYSGIVVDNSGYNNSITKEGERFIGRVLVKINGITPYSFSESFKALPSKNVNSVVDLESTQRNEVLAYVLQPILGESTQGIYDPNTDTTKAMREDAPSKAFKFFGTKTRGAFGAGPEANNTPVNNSTDYDYYPNYPWNTGLGSYSIPEVNTVVAIKFLNGNRSFPIIIGKIPADDELNSFYKRGGIFGSMPGKGQNYGGKKDTSQDQDTTKEGESVTPLKGKSTGPATSEVFSPIKTTIT